MKKYIGFMVLNIQNGVQVKFNYIKGIDTDQCELNAIKTLMSQSGLDRSNFIISSLIKK